MDGGGFIFAPRSDAQQEYAHAWLQQRSAGIVNHELQIAGMPDNRLGKLSTQRVECYELADTEVDVAERKESAAPPVYTEQEEDRNPHRRPYQLRHGRRYIQNRSYPLPCDLQELNRQNIKTQMACSVFGTAICAPLSSPPRRVLEIGCGTAYWTSRCHQMLSSMGHDNVQYTGLDVAPLAPDLKQQGLNWRFVQHDMRRTPWPFDDGTFDLIMCKDMSLAVPNGTPTQRVMDECIRLLRVGGVLEVWESDYAIRSIQPHQPSPRQDEWEQGIAEETATFPMSPATPFASTQNRFLKSANTWIDRALEVYKLPSTPCTKIAPMLLQEPGNLGDISFRRIAVPLRELSWEWKLNSEQLAVREAAQLVVTGMIDSLEPVLRQASGKNAEEWSYWWAGMLASLATPEEKFGEGECLELGAWWATKLGDDDSDDC